MTFCAKYNLFASLCMFTEKKKRGGCLFNHFNKRNTTINLSRLSDTVHQHDLNMSGQIRELASKYFLVNRKQGGKVYELGFTSIFFTAQPISIRCMWVWLTRDQGWMAESMTQSEEQTKGQTRNGKRETMNARSVKHYSIKHSGRG